MAVRATARVSATIAIFTAAYFLPTIGAVARSCPTKSGTEIRTGVSRVAPEPVLKLVADA
jgi:hypothetical protein